MIEQYIEHTCGRIQERSGGSGGIAVHELKPFLPADALAWCKADATEHLMNEWSEGGPTSRILNANAENPRVVRAAVGSLLPFYVYDNAIVVDTVRTALTFAAQYASKPRETLAHHVFRGAPGISGALLQIRLSAAVEYRYLPTLLTRNLGSQQHITPGQFDHAVAAIDDAAIRQHNPDEFARLMRPMIRWSALAGGDPNGVPVDALLDFLADKRLQVLRDYVASIARIRSRTTMDFSEIATLVRDIEVKDVTHLKGAPIPEPSIPEQEPVPLPPVPEPAIPSEIEGLPEEQPAEAVAPDIPNPPIVEAIEKETTDDFALTEPEVTPPVEPPHAAPPALPALPPRIFNPDMRASLSNSLFHGNVAYFDVTVNELSRLQNWREAATYLTDLLEINRLNPYAADVMQFTDAIRRWFVRDDEETSS